MKSLIQGSVPAHFTHVFTAVRNPHYVSSLPPGQCLAPTRYVPRGYRVANADEITARQTAQELKIPTENALQVAAPAMAALVVGPRWLVPVPASNGSVSATSN